MYAAKGRMDEGSSRVWCKRLADLTEPRVTAFWFYRDIKKAPNCDPSLVVILPEYDRTIPAVYDFWCGTHRYRFEVTEEQVRLDCYDVPALHATAVV